MTSAYAERPRPASRFDDPAPPAGDDGVSRRDGEGIAEAHQQKERTPMSVTSRARSLTRTGLKVQRRIVIAQALWWPTVLLAGAAIGTAALVVVKRRTAATQRRPDPVLAAPPISA